MLEHFDFWQFIAGLGVFLYGMHALENALKSLAGRSFKIFLKKFTKNPVKGVLAGILITAALQSSSLVTLMILAFLGAGIISLRNALGVVLGANLGTTLTAWIVATLGFKFSIESFSFPFIAIGALGVVFLNANSRFSKISGFLLGFGMLFLGLDFMKESIDNLAAQINISDYSGYGTGFFLLMGIVITALIQSSSATTVIVLGSLNAGMLTVLQATAVVIGANIGTTITVLIGAIKGVPDKKRLSLAHFLFNVVTALLFFVFLEKILTWYYTFITLEDELIELVLFNTLFNLVGVLLFLPFLGLLTKFLNKRFSRPSANFQTQFIQNINPEDVELAIPAMRKDTVLLLNKTLELARNTFHTNYRKEIKVSHIRTLKDIFRNDEVFEIKYQNLKEIADEIIGYYFNIQKHKLAPGDIMTLEELMSAVRNSIYAAKNIKDIIHNIREIDNTTDKSAIKIYKEIQERLKAIHDEMENLFQARGGSFSILVSKISHSNKDNYSQMTEFIYSISRIRWFSEIKSSSINNINQEIYAFNKNLIRAFEHLNNSDGIVKKEDESVLFMKEQPDNLI